MSQDTRPPRGGFSGWWSVSALFVIAVLLAALAVILLRDRGPAGPGAAPTATAGAPTAPAGAGDGSPAAGSAAGAGGSGRQESGGACSVPAGDHAVPTQAPAGITWEVVNSVAVPRSDSAGPMVRGAERRCYAHSPLGALIAAVNLVATSEGPQAARVLADQVLPGPNRDAQLGSARTNPPQPKQPGESGAIAGFRFIDYSADGSTAVLELAGAQAGVYARGVYRLQWSGGDWKLNLDPPGGAVPGQRIASLDGYVPWGA